MGKNPKQTGLGSTLWRRETTMVIPTIVLLFPHRTCQFSARGRET